MSKHLPKPRRRYVPKPIKYGIAIFVAVSWIPFALVALVLTTYSEKPPVHIFLDMDQQPKLRAQLQTPMFADDRTMQPRIAGAVARGQLHEDDLRYRGYVAGPDGEPVTFETEAGIDRQWLTGYPEGLEVNMQTLARGQERFNIFCAPCHGASGQGNGMVHQRAVALNSAGWVQPSNLVSVDAEGKLLYGDDLFPNGKLFNVITHGIRTMPPYGAQISVDDRWAIIAYVRALQLAQHASIDDVPQDKREILR